MVIAATVRLGRTFLRFAPFSVLTLLGAPSVAHADVSSWLFAGGGYALTEDEGKTAGHGGLRLQLGTGSSPDALFVVGGTAHTLSLFGAGTDLALTARLATGSFVRGDWGIALDAGGYQRWWGEGSSGFLGSVALGAPWGLQAVLDFETGTRSARTYAAFVGVDLLRLTVYRTTGTSWFPNPKPAAK